MKFSKALLPAFMVVLAIAVLPACKTKKAVVKPPPPPPVQKAAPATPPPPPPAQPAEQPAPPPPPAPPNYSFRNIHFEFDSGTLKTESYPLLDKAVAEMKKDDNVKFMISGHSSAEGSAQHNMALSVERANSVKTYLVNSGIPANNLSVKGYGETKPATDNTTEEGRELNRRVEITKQ